MTLSDPADQAPLICSSKGCDAPAQHALLWNNPKIHTPDRRKTWLACDEHEPTLRQFLSARGFWKETQPLPADG
ncbi:acetone carboxylase [Mumia sp. Pv 4-285]|uniref:acetone carboxylase n=1 Tax=Mumia qirimensis TaxID=3234852 RepID=UPI00351CDBB9